MMKPLICSQCGIATLHLVANGLDAGIYEQCYARRMMQLYRLRALEWSGSRERLYFAQEFENGLRDE